MQIHKLSSVFVTGMLSSRWGQWSRDVGSFLVLVASLTALALAVGNQYGEAWIGHSMAAGSSPDAPSADASASPGIAVPALAPTEESRYRALSEFVAKRYRVSQDVAFDLVSLAHGVGHQIQLDPLLIIAVIAIESRFNPIAESVAGAKGLMQIIPKYHGDKLEEFGGEQAVFDPVINIRVGSRILREYIRHTGNVGIALQMYAGALGDGEDQYTHKVLNEKARLQRVLSQSAKRPNPSAAVRTASARSTEPAALAVD